MKAINFMMVRLSLIISSTKSAISAQFLRTWRCQASDLGNAIKAHIASLPYLIGANIDGGLTGEGQDYGN